MGQVSTKSFFSGKKTGEAPRTASAEKFGDQGVPQLKKSQGCTHFFVKIHSSTRLLDNGHSPPGCFASTGQLFCSPLPPPSQPDQPPGNKYKPSIVTSARSPFSSKCFMLLMLLSSHHLKCSCHYHHITSCYHLIISSPSCCYHLSLAAY